MLSGSRKTAIPGLAPPPVLIFFHIPKTGGDTMKKVIEHCLRDEQFNAYLKMPDTALLVRSTAKVAEKFHKLPIERQHAVRCVVGTHFTFDIASIFDKPSKFFTIVRHPVDRVVSNFFHNQMMSHLPCYPFIKDMTLEQYLDSGIGLDQDNHQVRMLSGCPELDGPWDLEGRPISIRPVERRHLEMAKRNIEERFIVAAPLEKYNALVWFLKRLYGWPSHRILYLNQNETPNRPTLEALSEVTRKRLEALNQYDIDLYEWVKNRFTEQIEPLEPNFSREVHLFEMLNRAMQRIDRLIPLPIRHQAHRLLFPSG